MRLNRCIPACALLALICCVAPAQTTHSGSLSFSYDPIHDQINSSGISVKPMHVHPGPPPAPTPTTGTVVVTLNISLVSKYAKANHVNCSMMLVGGDIDLASGTVDGGVETATTHAKWSGHDSAVCTLTIPYSWTLSPTASASGLILVFGAADHCDDDDMVVRSTLQLDGPESLPANGGTAQYTFDVAL